MAAYRILIKTSARKELEQVGPARSDRQRVVRRIEALADEPRPPACEKLRGSEDRYRVRQGSNRVIREVDDAARTVTIVGIGHRRDVYR